MGLFGWSFAVIRRDVHDPKVSLVLFPAKVEKLSVRGKREPRIVRLQVAVGDAFLVRSGDGVCERNRELEELAQRDPLLGRSSVKVFPFTSSIVMKWTPSASSTECTVTMLG